MDASFANPARLLNRIYGGGRKLDSPRRFWHASLISGTRRTRNPLPMKACLQNALGPLADIPLNIRFRQADLMTPLDAALHGCCDLLSCLCDCHFGCGIFELTKL